VRWPTFSEFVHRYEALLQKHIREGRLTEKQAIRPGRAFEDPKGTIHILGVNQEPQPDWVYKDPSGSAKLLTQMLAAGYFPVSHNHRSLHDLCHLAALIANPEYMARIREMAQPSVPEKPRIEGRSHHMSLRFLFLLEGLVVVPKENQAKLLPLLSEPIQKRPADIVTIAEVQQYWTAKPEGEARKQAKKLLKELPALLKHYGQFEIGAAGYNIGLHDSIETIRMDLEHVLDNDPSLLPLAIARLEIAAWYSTRVTMEVAFDELLAPKSNPKGPVYQWIVTSGLGKSSSLLQEGTKRPSDLHESLIQTAP
jgi:hypothetical protein